MSRNTSGRSWYRLSSINRPTPHASRDPSPPRRHRRAIEPSPSPSSQSTSSSSLSPPSPRTPPKQVKEAKPSPVPSQFIKHESPKARHEPQNIPTSSNKTNMEQKQQQESLKEAKPSPVPSPRSIKQEPPKYRHEHETTTQNIRTSPDKTNLVHQPNNKQQQSPPKEVKETKPSPVPSSRFIKHDPKSTHEPPKPRHEHNHEHVLTSSIKTTLVQHGLNNEQPQDSNEPDDFIKGAITISAANRGAIMEIVRSPNKTRGAETGKEEKVTSKSKPKKSSKNNEYLPMNGFVNSNVQMINGSVVYNSTDTHHDPGVHLSLCLKPLGFVIKAHGDGYTSSIN